MTLSSSDAIRRIWPYSFGAMPFMAAWFYLLAVYFPGHPTQPDPETGRTVALGVSHQTVYVSGWEMAMLLGVFACMAAILGTGLFRTFRAAGKI